MKNRRSFLKQSLLGGAVIATFPKAVSAGTPKKKSKKISLEKGDVILFQGDSITDAGRDKKNLKSNNNAALGRGYAYNTAIDILCNDAEKDLKIYNRGISGNKVYQLANRWEVDCLELKPKVLSLLIGVNDYWHMRNGKYDGDVAVYEKDFRALLQRTKEALPETSIVICQPFILANTKAVDETWLKPFSAYQKVAKKLATEFSATWVPFQEVFDKALSKAPETYWLRDGVHPTMAGAKLMADAWMKAVWG